MADAKSMQLVREEQAARFIYESLSRPEVATRYPNLHATAKELWYESIAALYGSKATSTPTRWPPSSSARRWTNRNGKRP